MSVYLTNEIKNRYFFGDVQLRRKYISEAQAREILHDSDKVTFLTDKVPPYLQRSVRKWGVNTYVVFKPTGDDKSIRLYPHDKMVVIEVNKDKSLTFSLWIVDGMILQDYNQEEEGN